MTEPTGPDALYLALDEAPDDSITLRALADWYEEQGGKPSLRNFHDALLSHGSAPFWALRRLMLKHHDDVVME